MLLPTSEQSLIVQPKPFSPPQNHLLTMLPPPSRRLLFAELEYLELPKDYQMASMGDLVSYVYFMNSGIGSVILTSDSGKSSEAGLFGSEGFSPAFVAVGRDYSPYNIVVQSPGTGYRMRAGAFRDIVTKDRLVATIALRYVHVLALQASYTAHSNALDSVDSRLARWLLMCHDRLWGNDIELTHEYLALMLGVRRPSVTTALHSLEGDGLLRSKRGVISIRDRKGLERLVGSSYGAAEREYHALISEMLSQDRIGGAHQAHDPHAVSGVAIGRGQD